MLDCLVSPGKAEEADMDCPTFCLLSTTHCGENHPPFMDTAKWGSEAKATLGEKLNGERDFHRSCSICPDDDNSCCDHKLKESLQQVDYWRSHHVLGHFRHLSVHCRPWSGQVPAGGVKQMLISDNDDHICHDNFILTMTQRWVLVGCWVEKAVWGEGTSRQGLIQIFSL